MNSMPKKISIVIPVYQNAASIKITCVEVAAAIELADECVDFEFVLVNDGSTDGSWEVMRQLQLESPEKFTLINLTRNFGQLPALLAGYNQAKGDAVISMSADMQDPPTIIRDMLNAWHEGHKLVIANRIGRADGLINDFVSNFSWRVLKRFALPTLPKGGFDFFLMDASIRNYYVDNPEQHMFMQGRLLFYGETPYQIPYERQRRHSGTSQTTLGKKVKYLIDGFAGYSYMPLRMISLAGIGLFLTSVFGVVWILWYVNIYGSTVEGWASLMVIILFLNGVQLLSFGVIGEYLWRNIEEVRKRPHYIIDQVVGARIDA